MLASILLLAASCAAQSVTLPGGTLQGGKCATSNASYFYSVPYAKPPVGALRFSAPQPYNGSYGQATTASPNCPQFGLEFIEMSTTSEDCLYLDIWTPPNAANLPVKVWIYGGGNTAGSVSNPTYNGCNLAATGSVVVAINYRLGPLGFLALNNFGIQGNFGTQDQLLALNWVKSNIKAFGGDPSKVVLFGQSAGAVDSYVISSLPQASSLLQGGISESGGGRRLPSSAAENAFGQRYAASLNCSNAACLRSLSLSQLNITLPKATGPTYYPDNPGSFGPYVDGSIIPANPGDVGVKIPFIFGYTTQEGTLLILSLPGITSPADITPAYYSAYLTATYGPAAPQVLAQYSIAAFNNTAYPAFYAMTQVMADTTGCAAYQGLNRASANNVPVWGYRWAQAPTCAWYNNIPPAALPFFGAAHTAEIPYVFANVNNNPPPSGTCNFTANEKQLSNQFVGFWTGMATSGNPGAAWPRYSMASSMGLQVMNGSTGGVGGVIDFSICAFWSQVNATIAQNMSAAASASASSSAGGPIATYKSGGANVESRVGFMLGFAGLVTLCCWLL